MLVGGERAFVHLDTRRKHFFKPEPFGCRRRGGPYPSNNQTTSVFCCPLWFHSPGLEVVVEERGKYWDDDESRAYSRLKISSLPSMNHRSALIRLG